MTANRRSSKPRLKLVPTAPPISGEVGDPRQREMPFAVVEGEPVTELPRDLYIPPHALKVFLQAFEGPLDLLLYLIRRQNLDILDIPIAEVTEQYTRYIELMQDMQFELAGEYLVMAATLAEIIRTRTADEWEAFFNEAGVPAARVRTLALPCHGIFVWTMDFPRGMLAPCHSPRSAAPCATRRRLRA